MSETWITVDIDDMIGGWGRLMMEQVRRDAKAIRDVGFRVVAGKVVNRAQKETRSLDKVFHGTFLQGWGWEETARGGDLINAAPHAARVEFGTPPGSDVSFSAILEWTRVKLYGLPRRKPAPAINFGRATPITRGGAIFTQRVIRSRMERAARRGVRGDRSEMEDEADRAARNIHRAIRERGVAPSFIFRNALQRAPDDFGRWVKQNLPYPRIDF